MTNREKGMTKIQKCEYLENKSSFLDEIKSIFHNHLRAIIWKKKKKKMNTSFNTISGNQAKDR